MPAKKKTTSGSPAHFGQPREPFDAQATFQMHRYEKLAALSLIDGRRFKNQGDVFREMMYFYFEQHDIEPGAFRSQAAELANSL